MIYGSAREFFDAVRAAAQDIERTTRRLEALEESAYGVSGFDPTAIRVRTSCSGGDAMALRVDRLVRDRQRLEDRIEEDYRMIDAADAVLYGNDFADGLAALAPPLWADLLYHHYVALRTWREVAALVGYSEKYCIALSRAAFDVLDANGDRWTRLGVGFAEG